MIFLQLTSRTNHSPIYVNAASIIEIGTSNGHARLRCMTTSGSDGGSHSAHSINVHETAETVVEMLGQGEGVMIISPPRQDP
ncbi:hypothetical protein [Methylobacterium sp. D48H]